MSRNEQTRRAILQVAWELFADAGSPAVRMQDVAYAAGVTRQTVYFHFDNRANLLVAVARYIDESVERLPERAAPVWDSESGRQAVGRFVELVADYYPTILDIMNEVYSARVTDSDVDAAWRDRLESRKDACRGLVEWLDRDGDLTDELAAEVATDLLTTLTSFGTWEDLTAYHGWDRAGYVYHLTRVIDRTLTDTPGRDHRPTPRSRG